MITDYLLEVDKDDNPIGVQPDYDFFMNDRIHRGVHLIITDHLSRILLQKRSSSKILYPNLYTSSVSGSIVYGETCEEGLLRETQEEIGSVFDFTFICKFLCMTQYDCAWSYFYGTKYNGEHLIHNEGEISELIWFSSDDLKKMITKQPFLLTPPTLEFFKTYYIN